jgi:hypothetical protein
MVERPDRRGPSVDLFQPLDSSAPLAGDDHVDVPVPSCPNHPFSEELSNAEINTCIHRVLTHGVNLNPGAGPTPLREVVDSTRVSLFAFAFGNLCNLICSWHSHPPIGSCVFSQCTMGVTLPEDAARREVNHALIEWLRERRQMR